jgi:predicted transcriptional regulator
MPATSLKLSNELRQRISALVRGTNQTAHAFMVEAIERAAKQEELRRAFGAEALDAEGETERTGLTYDPDSVFDYLEARARGKPARKPRAKSWPRSG